MVVRKGRRYFISGYGAYRKMNIICISGVLYDYKLWNNRQHIMTRMANRGNRVIYVEPPKSILLQALKLIFGVSPEQNTGKWFRRLFGSEERQKNLFIFSLIKFLPTKYRFSRHLNYLLNLLWLKREIRKKNMDDAVLWIYTPEAVTLAGRIGESLIVYDCVDEYTAQPYYSKNFNGIDKNEIELLRKSDIVFSSAKNLAKKKKKYNTNTYFIPNAGDYEHFIKATHEETKIPDDIAKIPHPCLGFVGAMDNYKLDIKLVLYLAVERPDWSIVLIGQVGVSENSLDLSSIKDCGNIYMFGSKKYNDLPAYIKNFDVCLIPYRFNEYTKNCFPIKFFEYLATGKPVVVSGLPELEEYKNIVGIAHNYEEFLELIKHALKNGDELQKKERLSLARNNTWDSKVSRQLEIIESFIRGQNN